MIKKLKTFWQLLQIVEHISVLNYKENLIICIKGVNFYFNDRDLFINSQRYIGLNSQLNSLNHSIEKKYDNVIPIRK